jgi:hypothetical protein
VARRGADALEHGLDTMSSWPAVAAVAMAASLARLPFLGVGLVPDEGGYAYVASAWADGGRLYHDAWVDRPQGLLVLYRLLLGVHQGPLAMRLGAAGAATAVTVLLVAVGWLVHSRGAGICAAGLYAVLGVAPRIEGYTLHAELAAAVPATAAIAAALCWRRRGRPSLLVLAGLLGGAGVLMKQTGFDGLLVAVAIAVSCAPDGRAALHRAGLVIAGAAAALGSSALHGALVGFDGYWDALVGYRLGLDPSPSERVANFARSLDLAARDLLPLAIVAAVGAARCVRDGARGAVPLVWLATAVGGFHVSGAYWAHHYVQLIAPLSLLAGIAIAGLHRPSLRVPAAAAALAPMAVVLGQLAVAAPAERLAVIPSAPAAERDERVARHLQRHTTREERIYVLVSRANVYFTAERRAPTPYLWHPPLRRIPGAMRELERELASPRGPAYVAVYQPVAHVDRTGRLERILAAHYVADRCAPPGSPPILARRHRRPTTARSGACTKPAHAQAVS